MSFDSSYLELLLQKAKFEQGLGANILRIAQTQIKNEPVVLLEVKVDKGLDIIPHLHEHGGEIVTPLTSGTLRFGQPQKDENGNFKKEGGKVVVTWDVMVHELEPGRSMEVPEGIAHHFVAHDDAPMIVLFFLPETHPSGADRIYTTYPKGFKSTKVGVDTVAK